MSLITWDQSFSVKVERCDNEHRKPFDLIDQKYLTHLNSCGIH